MSMNNIPQQLGIPAELLPQVPDMYNTPTAIPQDSYWNRPIEQRMADIAPATEYQSGMSDLDVRGWNILDNFKKDAQEAATGLANIWTGLWDGTLAPEVINYLTSTSGKQMVTDFANANLEPYNIDITKLKGRSARDILGGIAQGIYENPFDATLDAISFGALKPLGKVADKLNSISGKAIFSGEKASAIERGLATGDQAVKSDINKLYTNIDKIKKDNLPELIRAAEEGTDIPKEWKQDFKNLREFSKDYDELAKKYAPDTYVGPRETAIVQKIARETGSTYQAVRNEIKPILEELDAGNIKINEIPRGQYADKLPNAIKLYDEGRIFPVTHGLAEVQKLGNDINAAERIKAGRFTTREYGTAAYQDIAKQLSKPETFLEGLSRKYLDKYVSDEILTGKLGGVSISPTDIKNAVYVPRAELQTGNLTQALKKAKSERLLPDDIPVDKVMIEELKKQTESSSGAFAGLARDLYQTGKSSLLSQGTYLGANAITGGLNAIMNSNAGLIQDVLSAVGSKGRLAKELGVYRRDAETISKAPILKQVQQVNNALGGNAFRKTDALIQNTLAEIAAHSEFRKAGIPANKRMDAIAEMDKAKLGQIISDTKKAALINSSNTLLPKMATDALSAWNPFWRWTDTATQSSIRLLEKSPVLSNMVLMDVLANIGFDKEMQNRLNLGVSLDTPYITYKFDDKTGQIKQTSAEFVPISTTIKFLAPDKESSFAPSIPFFTAIMNSLEGKDKYGNINKRALNNQEIIQTVGTKRIKYNTDGTYEEVGGMGDEILSTAIKELIGPVNLYNRTVAPTIAGVIGKLSGQDLHYNQPYAQSILGSFDDRELNNNILFGGSMDRQRDLNTVLKALSGRYESKYFPTDPRMSPSDIRSFWRQYGRNTQRRTLQ